MIKVLIAVSWKVRIHDIYSTVRPVYSCHHRDTTKWLLYIEVICLQGVTYLYPYYFKNNYWPYINEHQKCKKQQLCENWCLLQLLKFILLQVLNYLSASPFFALIITTANSLITFAGLPCFLYPPHLHLTPQLLPPICWVFKGGTCSSLFSKNIVIVMSEWNCWARSSSSSPCSIPANGSSVESQ